MRLPMATKLLAVSSNMLLLVMALFEGCTLHSDLLPTATTTGLTASPSTRPDMVTPQVSAPRWRDITPGQTTKSEVLRILGQPNTTQTYQDLESLNYYPWGWYSLNTHNYRVILKKDTVQLIIVNERARTEFYLSDFTKQYGPWETITEWAGPYPAVYVFATRGLAVTSVGNAATAVEYFIPMSTSEYLASWGQYHLYHRPFPLPCSRHPVEVGLVPDKSTKRDVLRIYGEPDYRGWTDRWGYPPDYTCGGELEIYSYRIPAGVKTQNIFDWQTLISFLFDERGVVRLIHLWGVIGPRWTIADAIAEYGEPEWVFVKKGQWSEFPDNRRGYFFPQKGVAVVTVGYREARPSDHLQSEWFYAPMSREEYEVSWGENPSVGWSSVGKCLLNVELQEWSGFPSE